LSPNHRGPTIAGPLKAIARRTRLATEAGWRWWGLLGQIVGAVLRPLICPSEFGTDLQDMAVASAADALVVFAGVEMSGCAVAEIRLPRGKCGLDQRSVAAKPDICSRQERADDIWFDVRRGRRLRLAPDLQQVGNRRVVDLD